MSRIPLFPRLPLEEALQIANIIWEENAGEPMRRITIFDTLNRSPSSSTSRFLITASSSYGLTTGGYNAEEIKLTQRGLVVTKDKDIKGKIDAVIGVKIFESFFEKYKNATLPSDAAAKDFLRGEGIPEKDLNLCLEIILKNGIDVKLIQEISGTERIVSLDHALETVQEEKQELGGKKEREAEKPIAGKKSIPSVNINIEIHLPSDAKPDTYSAIFKNIKEHLMGEE